ncbi:MAG: GWxTD domain-containing protein [Bryobacterales bacterium]|nr:GWxTD domain-containing protein [Bryobacterales bacterium]
MIYGLGWALIHFVWQGTAIALVLALALALARSGRARYALACVGLAAMAGSFGATFILWMPGASGNSGAVSFARSSASPGFALGAPGFDWMAQLQFAMPWLVALWMACAAILGVYRVFGWFAVRRLRTVGVCVPGGAWRQRFELLRQRAGVSQPVVLLASALAEIPMVVGFLKPVVLLPVSVLTALPAEQLEAILAHELAHIRRADYLVNLLQTLVETVLFYHPAVWWTSRVIRVEREHACDDIVLELQGHPHSYASALVNLEHQRAGAQRLAVAATGGDLMHRIERLLGQGESDRRAASLLPALAIVLAACGTLAFAWQGATKATPYEKWLNEDVAYIIKLDERKAFTRLRTDEERDRFIEQFWQRRDPTPGAAPNEFKEEHYRRIGYANKRFGTQSRAGWTTDRGRMYITYGPPDEIESHPRDGFEKWLYHEMRGLGERVVFSFHDPDKTGEYRMSGPPKPLHPPKPIPLHKSK